MSLPQDEQRHDDDDADDGVYCSNLSSSTNPPSPSPFISDLNASSLPIVAGDVAHTGN